MRKFIKFFIIASLLVILLVLLSRQTGSPIVKAIQLKPDTRETRWRGPYPTTILVYRKIAGKNIYKDIVNDVENSEVFKKLGYTKTVDPLISEFTAKSLGLEEWGKFEATYISASDQSLYCTIVDRIADVYVVVRN